MATSISISKGSVVLLPELMSLIFEYLCVKDKGRVARVCKKWRYAAYNRRVWKNVVAKLHLRRTKINVFKGLMKRGITQVQVLSLRRNIETLVEGVPLISSLSLTGCVNVLDSTLMFALFDEKPSLIKLNLSLCKQITDVSLSRIAQNLKNLEVLELGGCSNITNIGVLTLSIGLTKLKMLNLRSCCLISDQGLAFVSGQCDEKCGNLELEHLVLQDCQKVSDKSLYYISQGLMNLVTINLSFCLNLTDLGIKYLSTMINLCELNLRSCDHISDAGLRYLSQGKAQLSVLDVSFCDKVGDEGLISLSHGLTSLKSLSFNACSISDKGIDSLVSSLHHLRILNIGQCVMISDKSLLMISKCLLNLECIDLYGCTKITSFGLHSIMELSSLKTLNLGLWHKKSTDKMDF